MEVLAWNDMLKPRVKRSRSIMEREEGNTEQYNNSNNQLVIYRNSFKNSSLSYAWNAYFDKNKVKKNIMVCCDLNKICNEILKGIENNSLTIKTFSFLFIGVCNIYKKKVHFVGQDYDLLKRKILSLYKNKDQDVDELGNSKDLKRRKVGKNDNGDDSSGNKRRLSKTPLNIKRGSIGLNEAIPSIIDDFTGRKSRFSLAADEISIAGTEPNNGYYLNDSEMNNQMLMDISGINDFNFDNDNTTNNNNMNNNYHDLEKALEGSFISRHSTPINNLDGLNLNRSLSESFNHMDKLNAENPILNNMIPKNMFSNLDASLNEKSMGGNFNNLEFNSVNKSDGFNSMSFYNNAVNGDNVNNLNLSNDYMNGIGGNPYIRTDNTNMFNNMKDRSGINNLNGGMSASKEFQDIPYNNNFTGTFQNMHSPMNNRNDMYNFNPYIRMNSMNNNNFDGRNNLNNFSQRINNQFGDIDAMSNVMVGSMFSPRKQKATPQKANYLNRLNFEAYQNFDYFDQKDDDVFIKKLNSLLGLDESEGEEEKGKKGEESLAIPEEGKEKGDSSDKDDFDMDISDDEKDKNKNNELALEGKDPNNNKLDVSTSNKSDTMQGSKKRKLEKQIVDKNYMIKESVMRGILKNESVNYKKFLIDTINNEINEQIQREHREFQNFCLQSNNDKIKPIYKMEINFGYESLDYEEKKNVLENYLSYSVNDATYLYENKNILDNFNIRKCLDNIDGNVISNENDSALSSNFLSFENNEEIMKNNSLNIEEVREQFNGFPLDRDHVIPSEFKSKFSIDLSMTQNDPIDLNLNDLNFKDDMESRIHMDSQISKSLVLYGDDGSVSKVDDAQNIHNLNEKLNWEFNSSSLDLAGNSNSEFINIFSKDNESVILEDKSIDFDINLKQDFDLIAKDLLEVYKKLSKKINYIFFDLITKNDKSKEEISILFYITLHLANLGYIQVIQKPILPEHLNSYEENFSRPILIQLVDQKEN
ncbi:conserved Plasmodium protein, unknown function [Plasmodium chabaudi chabaudi]|uniref:Rad21/Rec8-like protein N-terminal domain-containing protein n=1 Tax=Plasmodium chabaudi chabaudi TaxID=31271 RepID=A0A1C6XHX3_PLACU|nr:conserved Plasmodium protein, unknown function [Plasmodium chabaudi chabaudi]